MVQAELEPAPEAPIADLCRNLCRGRAHLDSTTKAVGIIDQTQGLRSNPEGCQKVAGGHCVAATPGQERRGSCTPEWGARNIRGPCLSSLLASLRDARARRRGPGVSLRLDPRPPSFIPPGCAPPNPTSPSIVPAPAIVQPGSSSALRPCKMRPYCGLLKIEN
jgi:hypothetical protein